MNEINGENIICLAGDDWGSLWTNRQHIMSNLCKKNRVLYVESIAIRPPNFTNKKEIKKVFKKIIKLFTPIKKINNNLFLLSPLVIPKYNRVTAFLNRCLICAYIKYAQIRLGLKNPILWSYLPHMVWLVKFLKHKFVVYHCVDQYSEIPGVNAGFMNRLEEQFLEVCDIVFTTSKALYELKKTKNAHVFYMPNVADYKHFSKSLEDETSVPQDIKLISKPVIGYIGTICEHKFDVDLIDYISEQKPDYSFVIIGPWWGSNMTFNNKISSLEKRKNVYFFGKRTYDSLPGYLKAFDVCLIPHMVSRYMEYSFPLKMYEFMATGKPIVSTRFSSLEEFSDLIYLSNNREDFLSNIELAIEENSEKKRKARINLASQNTWETRVAKIENLIFNVLR